MACLEHLYCCIDILGYIDLSTVIQSFLANEKMMMIQGSKLTVVSSKFAC